MSITLMVIHTAIHTIKTTAIRTIMNIPMITGTRTATNIHIRRVPGIHISIAG